MKKFVQVFARLIVAIGFVVPMAGLAADDYLYDYDYYDAYDYGYNDTYYDDDWFYDYYEYGDAFSSPDYEYDYDWVEGEYEWEEKDLFFDDEVTD